MNRLKELRKKQKNTQQDMADILKMSRRGYQKIENGESQIKPDKAQELADYFGVSVGYLLGYEHKEGTATEAQLVLGKMLVEVFEELEADKSLGGQCQDVIVNGHAYKVTVVKGI